MKQPISHTPPGPRGHWLFGIAQDIRTDYLRTVLHMQRTYGDLVRYRFGGRYGYQVSHPDTIKYVLQDNQRNYQRSKALVSRFYLLAGNGLLTSEGDTWRRQRRLIQPAFHRQQIATLGSLMTAAAHMLAERWQSYDHQPINIASEMMRVTLRIAGEALFSMDLIDQASDVREAFAACSEELSSFSPLYLLLRTFFPRLSLPIPTNQRFTAGLHTLETVVQDIITHRRQHPPDQTDVLAMLMAARDEHTDEAMSDQQLRDEVLTLLLAGHETTALALTWTWYLLAQHPHVEQRLHDELDSVLAGRIPVVADLPNLVYTERVIQEAMRLYPPVHTITRQALAEDTIGEYGIPANATLVIQPYVVHRHPDFWDAPETFNPDRFVSEQVQTRHRFAYIPFGGGAHLCVGNVFAMTEARLVLATLAQRFRLSLLPDPPVQLEAAITLRPRYSIQMLLHRRQV